MNYLRNVVSDVKLKYRAGRVVYDCIAKREQPEFTQYLTECVNLADGHPELILSTLHEYLSFRQPENAYGGLLLLEQLVSLCNYGFHLALAKDYEIQDRIIQLAVKRGEGEAHRKAQRLARLTLLEYSRVFVDDRELLRLSSLASSFEHRTRKSLLRCLNVQNRRVRFRDVAKDDIIPISPKESLGSTSGNAARAVTPLRLSSAPEVWPCHVCTYLNAPSATRCAACETLRSVDSVAHRAATPQGTPKTTPKLAPQPHPPTPPPPHHEPSFASSSSSSPAEEDEREGGGGSQEETLEADQLVEQRNSPSACDADAHRHHDADLSLTPPTTSHAGPPSAVVFHDPVHLNDEEGRMGLTTSTTTAAETLATAGSDDSSTFAEHPQANSTSNEEGEVGASSTQPQAEKTHHAWPIFAEEDSGHGPMSLVPDGVGARITSDAAQPVDAPLQFLPKSPTSPPPGAAA